MTVKELSQIYYLEREINLIKSQLHNLREQRQECTVFDSVQSSSKHEPYQVHSLLISGVGPSAKSAALSEAILERKAKLTDVLAKREQELVRLEQYIASIPDSLTRQIFTLRFVKGQSWQQVASKTGGKNTADGVRKIVTRYLNGK